MLTISTKNIITDEIINNLEYRFNSLKDKESFIKHELQKSGWSYKKVNDNHYIGVSEDFKTVKIIIIN